MSELTALTRIFFLRHRTGLAIACSALLLAEIGIGLIEISVRDSTLSILREYQNLLSIACAVCIFGSMLWGVILLDFHRPYDRMDEGSGFDPWLQKLPIATWKLGLVPIIAKTLWAVLISSSILLASWIARLITPNSVRPGTLELKDILVFGMASLILASGGITIEGVIWRPFRNGFRRLMVIGILVPALWASLGVGGMFFIVFRMHSGWACLLAISMYVISVVWALTSLSKARTSTNGIVDPNASRVSMAKQAITSINDVRQNFESTVLALRWHDLARARRRPFFGLAVGLIPAIVVLIISTFYWDTLGSESGIEILVFTSFLTGFSVWLASAGINESTTHRAYPSIPEYLMTSPIELDELAWSRAKNMVLVAIPWAIVSLVLLIGSFWLFNDNNYFLKSARPSQVRWEILPGLNRASSWELGFRFAICFFAIAVPTIVGRPLAFAWTTLLGRRWVGPIVMAMLVAAFLLFQVSSQGINFLGAILRGENLGSTYWLVFACVILSIKIVTSILITGWSIFQGLVKPARAIKVVEAWLAFVILFGVIAWLANPSVRLSGPLTFCIVAIVTPLARVLLMPAMLSWNMHR